MVCIYQDVSSKIKATRCAAAGSEQPSVFFLVLLQVLMLTGRSQHYC